MTTGTSGISHFNSGNTLQPPEPVLTPSEWAANRLRILQHDLNDLADTADGCEPWERGLIVAGIRGAVAEVQNVLDGLS